MNGDPSSAMPYVHLAEAYRISGRLDDSEKMLKLANLGYFGQGVVVASLDTGVDVTHPDLSGSYRGGTDSWFDPYGQHPTTPTDLNGHGTWTMGVMVAGDASGETLGAAPQ